MRYDIDKFAKELSVIVAKLTELCKEHEGYSALWEVAVRKNDGVKEGMYREKLHMVTDQILDSKSRSIQLQQQYDGRN